MADTEPIIIVDADGNEHEFPAGMDPKKAAQIVRAHTIGEPISKDEPDTYLGGFFKGAKEGMSGGARGFFRGIGPGLKSIVTETVPALASGAVSAIKGTAALVDDPGKATADAIAGVSEAFKKVPQLFQDMKVLAGTNPEAFGEEVGKFTGNAEGMMALAVLVPMLPRPMALKVGQTLERVGKAGEFAAYLTGAHQIVRGDPKGIITLSMPGAMRAAAKPLIRFGTNKSAVPTADLIQMEPQGKSRAFNDMPLHEQMAQLPPETGASPAPQPNPNRFAGPPPVERPQTTGIPYDQPVGAAQHLEALAKLSPADRAAEMAARAAAFKNRPGVNSRAGKSPLGGAQPLETGTSAAPEPIPEAGPMERQLLDLDEGRPRAATELANEGSQRFMHDQFKQNRPAAAAAMEGAPLDPAIVEGARQEHFNGVEADNPALVLETRLRNPGPAKPAPVAEPPPAEPDLPPDADVTGEASYDGTPAPGPAAGGSLGAFEKELLPLADKPNLGTGSIDLEGPNVVPDEPLPAQATAEPTTAPFENQLLDAAADTPPAARRSRIPASEGPQSRSRRGPMSATPGYTVADIEGIGGNPSVRYKDFPQEVLDRIVANRAARAASHRTNAGLNKGLASALDRD